MAQPLKRRDRMVTHATRRSRQKKEPSDASAERDECAAPRHRCSRYGKECCSHNRSLSTVLGNRSGYRLHGSLPDMARRRFNTPCLDDLACRAKRTYDRYVCVRCTPLTNRPRYPIDEIARAAQDIRGRTFAWPN